MKVSSDELKEILDWETKTIQDGKVIGNCGWMRHKWFIDAREWVDVINKPQDKYSVIGLDVMVKHCLKCFTVKVDQSQNGIGDAIFAKRDYLLTSKGTKPAYTRNRKNFTEGGKRIYYVDPDMFGDPDMAVMWI